MCIHGIGGGPANPGAHRLKQADHSGGVKPGNPTPLQPQGGGPSGAAPVQDQVILSPEATGSIPHQSGGQTRGPGDGKPPLGPPEDPFGLGPAGREKHQDKGQSTPDIMTLMSGMANW